MTNHMPPRRWGLRRFFLDLLAIDRSLLWSLNGASEHDRDKPCRSRGNLFGHDFVRLAIIFFSGWPVATRCICIQVKPTPLTIRPGSLEVIDAACDLL
jgi:hypothetical protein